MTVDLAERDAALSPRASNSSGTAAPIVVPPSQLFDGIDGSWSTFLFTIGTPPQIFRLLPATNGQETWVPVPSGCAGQPDTCGNSRGANPFNLGPSRGYNSNASSTWSALQPERYQLIMEESQGLVGSADYGYESVGIGTQQAGLAGPVLTQQVVAEIDGTSGSDFWLGFFPLSEKSSNFTTSIPSYITNLAQEQKIPSKSFGYTAGAQYQGKTALGSLTLGGYDASRMTPGSNMTFDFASDDSRSFTVGLQSITATRTLQGTVAPLASGVLTLIDSGVPELWLPQAACAIFETAFGLYYDGNTDRYVVPNDTIHNQLTSLNSSITLNLGNSATGGSTIAIELPYAAFDLEANYPIYANATKYFPIRRAANDTQYALGRTFLQEAYLIADYERNKFTLSQAVPSDGSQSKIVAINASTDSPAITDPSLSSIQLHRLGPGGIAGLTIGAVIVALLISAFLFFYVRFRKQRQERELNRATDNVEDTAHLAACTEWKAELPLSSPTKPSKSSIHKFGTTDAGATTDVNSLPEEGSLVSALSPSGGNNEHGTPVSIKSGFPSTPRQELFGSPTAAEVHTSVWPIAAGLSRETTVRSPRTAAGGGSFSSVGSSSGVGTAASTGQTMPPIYELSGDDQWAGVRIKPILRNPH